MKLYNYYRSSASFRVRIALNLKGLKFEYVPVHLVKNGGENHQAEFRKLNPIGEVPCLIDGTFVLTQSMAIISYLDETYPVPRLFPAEPRLKAQVIEACAIVNSRTHPVHNVNVTNLLKNSLGASEGQVQSWIQNYIGRGLSALEAKLKTTAGTYSFGGTLTATDAFLVPQIFAAKRFAVDLTPYPTVTGISNRLMNLEAFKMAEPSKQPDAE